MYNFIERNHLCCVPGSTEQSTSKSRRRRARTLFTASALSHLEEVFRTDPYPDVVLREHLATTLNIPEARIQVCKLKICVVLFLNNHLELTLNHPIVS